MLVDFLGLAAPEWFFSLLQRISTSSPKYLSSLHSPFIFWCIVDHTHTHTHVEVTLYFSKLTHDIFIDWVEENLSD